MSKTESTKPLHQTIFVRLSRDITTDRYKPGQKFPSEAALVKRFNVSRITDGRAVRELQQRGLVDRVAGSGTHVRDPVRREVSGIDKDQPVYSITLGLSHVRSRWANQLRWGARGIAWPRRAAENR